MMGRPTANRAGQKIGLLTLVSRQESHGGAGKHALWKCACECGAECVVSSTSIQRGRTSCGCDTRSKFIAKVTKHGMSGSSTMRSWSAMMMRCTNPMVKDWGRYGALGITVCERWHKFESFLTDMGERPDGTSLDRLDNARGYEPGNCAWSTYREQSANRHNTVWVSYMGRTQTASDWSRELGLSQRTIHTRIRRGVSDPAALLAPPRR